MGSWNLSWSICWLFWLLFQPFAKIKQLSFPPCQVTLESLLYSIELKESVPFREIVQMPRLIGCYFLLTWKDGLLRSHIGLLRIFRLQISSVSLWFVIESSFADKILALAWAATQAFTFRQLQLCHRFLSWFFWICWCLEIQILLSHFNWC